MFDPELAGDFEATVQLQIDDQHFRAVVSDGTLEVERGQTSTTDARIRTDPGTLINVLHGHVDLADAVAAGDLEIAGDEKVAEPLPRPRAPSAASRRLSGIC